MIDKLYEGDSREVLKQFDDNFFDSIVTDPPYELAFMEKRWDSTGIAYSVDLWQECLRVLKPGGHLLAFGGTRTYHRMACAIEDAGFEIRDSIHWVYGSGFPKGMNISKQIDKLAGATREVVGKSSRHGGGTNNLYHGGIGNEVVPDITIPATEDAIKWDGWNTALKPAHEPIVMAQKPISEKSITRNVLKWGTGGINIEECRIGSAEDMDPGDFDDSKRTTPKFNNIYHQNKGLELRMREKGCPNGRFPANLIHDGSDEVLAEFAKAGESRSSLRSIGNGIGKGYHGCESDYATVRGHVDSGTPARFFKECTPDIPSIIYQTKASKKERGGSTHPTIKPISLIAYLVRIVTPPGGVVLDPFVGSGTLALAAEREGMHWVGIDLDLTEAKKRMNI